MPMIGVASTWIHAVPYKDQTKSGIRNQVIPGARSLWIVGKEIETRQNGRESQNKRSEHAQA